MNEQANGAEPLGWDHPPKACIRRVGAKTRGFMAWEAWVAVGLMKFAGEWGTYAWTEKRARRKAERLLRKYHAARSGPTVEVSP